MQFTVPGLRLGQALKAKLVEINQDESLIVDFDGDLLRVVNHSATDLEVGSVIDLVVVSVQPLKFQLSSSVKVGSTSRIDRFV